MSSIRRITQTLTPKRVALGMALLVAGVDIEYYLAVRSRLRQTDPERIQSMQIVSESLKQSTTVRDLVNPRGHVSKGDCHSIILTVPNENAPSEKDLLSSFVTGFFSGPVFLPEKLALSCFSPLKVSYDKLTPTPDQKLIWRSKQLSDNQLPPVSSILWGTFQIADVQLSDSTPTGSTADVVFGNSQGKFAGCHRFSAKRLDQSTPRGEIQFRLSLECLVCDPTSSEAKQSKLLQKLHNTYSYFLFRDAIAHTKSRFVSLE